MNHSLSGGGAEPQPQPVQQVGLTIAAAGFAGGSFNAPGNMAPQVKRVSQSLLNLLSVVAITEVGLTPQ